MSLTQPSPSATDSVSTTGSSNAAAKRSTRQLVPEKIYDSLIAARTADKVTIYLKNGLTLAGALIFNPFKGTGRIINVETETSTDFEIANIRDLKFS